MQFFKVKNFDKYQGDKRKSASNPSWVAPWIKIYHSMLDNFEFSELSEEDRFFLIGIFLLANRFKNKIPSDQRRLKHQLRTDKEIPLKLFIELEFIEPIEDEKAKPEKKAPERNPEDYPFDPILNEPTVEEIKMQAEMVGYGHIDAELFLTNYQGLGWELRTGVFCKDWRKPLIRWREMAKTLNKGTTGAKSAGSVGRQIVEALKQQENGKAIGRGEK